MKTCVSAQCAPGQQRMSLSLCSIDLNTPERVRYQSHHTNSRIHTDTQRAKYVEEYKYVKNWKFDKLHQKIDKQVENWQKYSYGADKSRFFYPAVTL